MASGGHGKRRTTYFLRHIGFSVDGFQARICPGAHAGEYFCLLGSPYRVPDAAAAWIGEGCSCRRLPDGPVLRPRNPRPLLALCERAAAQLAIDGGLLHLPRMAGRISKMPCRRTTVSLVLRRSG